MPDLQWMRRRPIPELPMVLVGLIVLGALLVGLAVQQRATTWTATSEVVYESGGSDALLGATPADVDVTRTLATQERVVLGDAVIGSVASRLDVSRTDLVEATTVEAVPDSNVLTISVEAGEPSEAQFFTQAVSDRYVAQARKSARQSLLAQVAALDGPIESLEAQAADASPGARATAIQTTLADLQQQRLRLQSAADAAQGPVRLLSEATEPKEPSSISTVTGVILGAGVGLVLAIGVYFLLDWARSNKARKASQA